MGPGLRTFRLVCAAGEEGRVEALLAAQGFACEPEPFFAQARRLSCEPFPLGGSLAARFGRIYIQDRSSMLPPLLLAPQPGETALDLCAAPGGKTGLLAGLVGPAGIVLAVEASRERLITLRANLKRMNVANAATLGADAGRLDLPAAAFSRILLDPPCSGWGTAEKHPRVLSLWTGDRTGGLTRLQRGLLSRAAGLLAPGGRLLYSTCTTHVEENERQVRFALDDLGLALAPLAAPVGFTAAPPALPGLDGVLRVGGQGQGQGFFLACLTRPGTGGSPAPAAGGPLPGARLNPRTLECPARMAWENLPPGGLFDFGGRVFFLPEKAIEGGWWGEGWQGLPLGRLRGRVFRPDPAAWLLVPGPRGAGSAEVLDLEDAGPIERLVAGQSLEAGPGGPCVGLCFRGLALGWLSRKGRRLLWGGG
jgi:16S rRNA (cytosine1407-C5)-methyltransferase